MNYLQHLLLSFVAAHALNTLLREPWSPPLFAAVFLGALAPDVDHARTKIFRFFLIAASASAFALAQATYANLFFSTLVALATAGLVFLVKPRHRSVTHSWLACAAFGLLVLALTKNPVAGVNGALSYFTHVLTDKL